MDLYHVSIKLWYYVVLSFHRKMINCPDWLNHRWTHHIHSSVLPFLSYHSICRQFSSLFSLEQFLSSFSMSAFSDNVENDFLIKSDPFLRYFSLHYFIEHFSLFLIDLKDWKRQSKAWSANGKAKSCRGNWVKSSERFKKGKQELLTIWFNKSFSHFFISFSRRQNSKRKL